MIAVIVEGSGEVEAVPVLLRRFIAQAGMYDIRVERPIKIKRNRIIKVGELEKSAELAKRSFPEADSLVFIIDADDDCPKELGPALLNRLKTSAPHLNCSVTLVKSEFEAWFLASIESLRGQRGIRDEIEAPEFPEDVRDAKGWLTQAMSGNRAYLETDDQAALAELFDFNLAYSRSRSFRKFSKDVNQILEQLRNS